MPYVVNMQLTGLTQVANQARQAVPAFKQLQQALQGMGGASGNGGTRMSSRGPWANAIQAQKNYAAAQQGGNPVQQFDAYVDMLRKQASLNRALNQATGSGNSWSKSLGRMVMSSRIGFGKNGLSVMPLVGQLIPALAKLGPYGIAAAVAISALAVHIQLLMKQIEFAMSFANAYFQGGGTMAQTGQLIGAGIGLGLSPAQMTQAANQYNESLKANPYANAMAQQGGYGPNYVGPFGDINNTQRFLKGLEAMLNAKTDDQARRMSMGTPLEGMEWARNLSPESKKQLMNDQHFQQSPDQLKAAAEATFQFNKAAGDLQQTLNTFAPDVAAVAAFLAAIAPIADILLKISMYLNPFYDLYILIKAIIDLVNGAGPDEEKNKQEIDAQVKHTDAMNNHARALDNASHTFGGGPGAANFAPYRGEFQPGHKGTSTHQIHLGQIPLG